jgi:hypothetical protein
MKVIVLDFPEFSSLLCQFFLNSQLGIEKNIIFFVFWSRCLHLDPSFTGKHRPLEQKHQKSISILTQLFPKKSQTRFELQTQSLLKNGTILCKKRLFLAILTNLQNKVCTTYCHSKEFFL